MRAVRDWMTGEPQTLGPYDSALTALERMIEGGFRHLPVLNAMGAVVGIVSLDDLRAALPFEVGLDAPRSSAMSEVARHYSIADVMTYLPAVVRDDCSLQDAARKLMEQRIGCLPVLDGEGELVGILTETDALRALVALLSERGAVPGPDPRKEPAELDRLVSQLQAEHARIQAELNRCQCEERSLAAAQRGEPLDVADRGALTSAGSLVGALAELASRRLTEIETGLERARKGVLGRCEGCGRRIPLGRLRALPSTDRCVECARQREQGAA
jgi:CBS domain-containing protein/RNA polymerase-binding transcription factor DksA